MANWPDEKLYVCRNKIQTQKYDTGLPETKKKKKYLMKLLDRSLLAIWQLYCFVSVCIATSPSKKVKVIEEPLETVTTGKETRTCTHASLLSACISQDNIGQEMIFIELQDLFA